MMNKKRQISFYSFYDRTGIQAHFEKMLEKGWMLEKINSFYWRYKRCTPQKGHFAVTYFPTASAYDPAPSPKQELFREFCEHSGWKHVANAAQMDVFFNESDNPVPIDTDAIVELDSIHSSAKKTFLPSFCILLLLSLLEIGLLLNSYFDDPISVLSLNESLLSGMCYFLLAIYCAIEIGCYLVWYKKALRQAELDGSFLETRSHIKFLFLILTIVFGSFALYLSNLFLYGETQYLYIAIFSFLSISIFVIIIKMIPTILKKKGMATKKNRNITIISTIILSFFYTFIIVTIITSTAQNGWFVESNEPSVANKTWNYDVYGEELPLVITDIIDTSYTYSSESAVKESIVLARFNVTQSPKNNSLSDMTYTVTKIKIPWLYDTIFDAVYYKYEQNFYKKYFDGLTYAYTEIDPSPWEAEIAYQLTVTYPNRNPSIKYVICYKDRILEIDPPDTVLTTEQMKVIAQKLKNI